MERPDGETDGDPMERSDGETDHLVAKCGGAEHELLDQPRAQRSVAVVPEVFAAWLAAAVTALATAGAVRVRRARRRHLGCLLLVVIEDRALGRVLRRAVGHVIRLRSRVEAQEPATVRQVPAVVSQRRRAPQ